MKDMIGYCGVDCEKCDAYLATVNDDQALREKTAKLWAELNNAPILPEHINCEGCRVNGAKAVFYEHMCEIRKCALEKGVSTCGDCSEMETCPTVGVILGNNNEICRLFVLPSYQNKGIGMEMLDFAEKTIFQHHSKVILDASLPAKKLYLKRGCRDIEFNIIATGVFKN